MNKYIVTINHVTYEITKKDTIENICKKIGITIPTIHLGSNDISKVEVNTSNYLVDARITLIENNMVIYTNSIKVRRYIRKNIEKLYNTLNISCHACPVLNCFLKQQFKKYNYNLEKTNNYELCNYYKQGIKSDLLIKKEHHETLQELLKDKTIHKVAVIEETLKDKIDSLYKKGFNEVINQELSQKIKMVEECSLCLKNISRYLDGDEDALPCVILENPKFINTLPASIQDRVVYKKSIYDIYDKVIKEVINSDKVRIIYISEKDYSDKENRIVVTYDYLMSLEDTVNSKVDNISKILKLDSGSINYNSFINYFVDVMKSKDVLTKDIYTCDFVNVKFRNKTFKIANYNYSKELDSDIILVLEKTKKEITKSFIKDVDINNIYKNHLKEPGKI